MMISLTATVVNLYILVFLHANTDSSCQYRDTHLGVLLIMYKFGGLGKLIAHMKGYKSEDPLCVVLQALRIRSVAVAVVNAQYVHRI